MGREEQLGGQREVPDSQLCSGETELFVLCRSGTGMVNKQTTKGKWRDSHWQEFSSFKRKNKWEK